MSQQDKVKTPPEFDSQNAELIGGNLIEASAGTGKTYTITELVLRLILNKNLELKEILVVTFTEAAASELKDRIRKKLREEENACFLREKSTEQDEDLKRIRCAINDFDQAAICTIHSFCLRVLQDHAFASGIQFDTELVTSEELYRLEIIQDFWRQYVYAASPLFYTYAGRVLNISTLQDLAKKTAGKPLLRVIPQQPEAPDFSGLEEAYQNLFKKLREQWAVSAPEVLKILQTDPALNRQQYRLKSISAWAQGMMDFLAGEPGGFTAFDRFDRFCQSTINTSINQGQSPPSHTFFALCDGLQAAWMDLVEAYDRKICCLKHQFLQLLKKTLREAKLRKSVLFFDDLLTKLEEALRKPISGDALAENIKNKFKAVLIDEFQDTDDIQYFIFDKIFGGPSSVLFQIGDPKQAIYGFRGADIFTYMAAKNATEEKNRFTLPENFRSEPGLIEAVNTVFEHCNNPFIFKDIPFYPVRAGGNKKRELLTSEGEQKPLQLWYVRGEKKPLSKAKARKLIADAVAAEIACLITQGRKEKACFHDVKGGTRQLRESDIAVLVRTNKEGELVQQSLSALRIHSVLSNMGNLFDSLEARDVQAVLAAIVNPGSESLLRAALATDMLGIDGYELNELNRNDEDLDAWFQTFGNYHDELKKSGFFPMFRKFLSQEAVLPRLITLPDGERRCTNVLHLSEVIHTASTEGSLKTLGMIVKWLAVQRNENALRSDEHQLRLESDENAVKIVTIHKSKGLEYPVVFCPFTWVGSELRSTPGGADFTFHDPAQGHKQTLDLGSERLAINRGLAEKELLAENLRLLYVAMTRAQNRCYLVWGRINHAGTSAPAYLLHHSEQGECDAGIGALKKRIAKKDDDALLVDLQMLQDKLSDEINLCNLPGGAAAPLSLEKEKITLTARPFKSKIDTSWGMHSHTSLVRELQRGEAHETGLVNGDEIIKSKSGPQNDSEKPAGAQQPQDSAMLPGGAAFGTFLHEIFEELDFSSPGSEANRALCENHLLNHRFQVPWPNPSWEDTAWVAQRCEDILRIIRNVLSAPLKAHPEGSFKLSDIDNAHRISEMEFFFSLKSTSADALKKMVDQLIFGQTAEVQTGEVSGFMTGKIDLIFESANRFYLLDWKSNNLGDDIDSYSQDSMKKTIRSSYYHLQYAIYTIALHRYLQLRLPGYSYEKHFGGVYYIFLRGVDPDSDCQRGIYFDRLSYDAVQKLCSVLLPQETSCK